MQIIVNTTESRVVATYGNDVEVDAANYPGCEVAWVPDDTEIDYSNVNAIPDPRPAMASTDLATARTVEAKCEAARRITAIAPEWKQRNLLAESVATGRLRALWSGKARARQKETRATWTKIQAVRTASDRLEAEIDSGAYTGAVAAWSGWPE